MTSFRNILFMKSLPFKIVDSHLHFWDPEQFGYPWLGHVPIIASKQTPDELLKAYPFVKEIDAVFVQAECRTEQALQEVEWVTQLSKKYPWIKGIVAYAPMNQGKKTQKWLESLDKNPLVKGIRHQLQGEEEATFCLKPDFVKGIQSLSYRGLVFDLCLKHHQLPQAIELVKKSPHNSFVLDHFGNASLKDDSFETWSHDLRRIAEFPHVSVKLSGLLTQLPTVVNSRKVSEIFKVVLDAFGPQRALFGSDWPVVNLNGNYEQWLEIVLQETSSLSETDRQAIFSKNAERIYHLKKDES